MKRDRTYIVYRPAKDNSVIKERKSFDKSSKNLGIVFFGSGEILKQ